MNEKIKTLFGKGKIVLRQITIYGIIGVTCVGSFFIGRFYDKLTKKETPLKVNVSTIKKQDVNLAIDQGNNLIIIDNSTGNYTIYQDSVGRTIFSLYAKNVWGQHNGSGQ